MGMFHTLSAQNMENGNRSISNTTERATRTLSQHPGRYSVSWVLALVLVLVLALVLVLVLTPPTINKFSA